MRNKKSREISRKLKFELRQVFSEHKVQTCFLKNKRSGFALIEVIVAIVVLALVLSAAIGLLYSVGSAVEANHNRLTATYLAQECLELVRNARDTAWKNYQPWDCAWQSNSSCPNIASILPAKNKIVVKVNSQKTKFSRELRIENVNNQKALSHNRNSAEKDEVMATCTVSWGENEKLSISEILTNWHKR